MAMPVLVQGQWRTINSATSNGSACYTLTPNVNPKVGAIEHAQVQNIDSAFTIQSSLYFGAAPCFFGMAFYIKASQINSLSVDDSYGLVGLDSILAVEFDIRRQVANSDPAQNHMAIFKNGNFDHSSSSLLSTTQNLYNLTDGAYHNVTISWTPKYSNLDSSLLRVVFDCDSVLDLYYNIKDSVLQGQTQAYLGFSGSSTNGGGYQAHSICIHHSTLENLRDTALCAGDSLQIEVPYYGTSYSWTPATGINNTSIRQPIFYPSASTTYTLSVTDSCGNVVMDSVTIERNDISVNSSPILGNRCALDSTLLPFSVTGGFVDTTEYLYRWSDGWRDSLHTVNPLNSTTYFITVEDTIGCSDTAQWTINTDTLPSVNLGFGSGPVCEDDTITLTAPADPSYSYSWFPGGSTANTFLVDTTVTVILSVTNSTPCIGKDTAIFTWVPRPVVNLGPDSSLCDGENMNLDAGNLGASFTWSPLAPDTHIIYVDSASTYAVTVTDGNNCSTSDSVVVTVDTIPVIDLGGDTSLCQGDTLFLDGGPNYQAYIWSNGSFTQTNQLTAAVSLSLVAVDSNDCQGSDNITLLIDTIPSIDLGPDTNVCDLDSVVLYAYSGLQSIQWIDSTLLTADSLIIKNARDYWIEITDSNGCVGFDTMTFGVDTLPIVFLGNDTSICDGFSIQLNAGLGYAAYNWINNASSNNLLNIDTTGSYFVEVTDSNECVASDTLNLTINALPNIEIGNDTSICIGDFKTLDPGAGYQSYLWNVGALTRTITVDSAFSYQVTVTDFNGCRDADTLTMGINQLPTVNLGPDRALCVGVPVNETLDAGPGYADYAWSVGGSGPASTHRTVVVTAQNDFSVTVTDINGCRDDDTINVSAVHLPTVSLGLDTTYCEGDAFIKVLNTGSGFVSHKWRNIQLLAGNDTISTNGQLLLVDSAGTFVVHIVELFNGRNCINSDTVNVIENPQPAVGIDGDITFCETDFGAGFTYNIDATPGTGNTYSWNTGESTSSIVATTKGFYTVTVTTTATGCKDTETFEIVQESLPALDLSNDTLVCEGEQTKFDAYNPGYTYLWESITDLVQDTGEIINMVDSAIWITDSGRYRVTITNGICTLSDTVDVEFDVFPKVNLGDDFTLCTGDKFVLDATFEDSEVEYHWQDGSTEATFTAGSTDLYIVEVSNRCGVDLTNVYISFEDCSNIWVPNTFTPNDDGDNDYFKVYTLENFIEYSLEITDQWGNVVYANSSQEIRWDGTSFAGNDLPVGTYVYKIEYKSQYEVLGPEGAPTRELVGMVTIVR